MATIDIELYKGKKVGLNKEYYSVRIRVYKDGVPKVKSIASAKEDEWNDETKRIRARSRKDYAVVNDKIETEWNKYKAVFKSLDESGRSWKAEDVFQTQKLLSPYFNVNALEYNSTLTGHSIEAADSRLAKVMRFAKHKDFYIDEINERWIAGFKNHCKTKEKNNKGKDVNGGLGNSDNTINSAIKYIRRVCKVAGNVPAPLSGIRLTTTKTIKRKLNNLELLNFSEAVTKPDSVPRHAKNFFMLCFYFRGMRAGDGLQLEWTDINGGRLNYDAGKTGKGYDMSISPEAQEILDQYPKDTKYVFPFYKFKYNPLLSAHINDKKRILHIKSCTAHINRNLKLIAKAVGITKNISTHINRHSFASVADTELEGDVKTIQQLLNHGSRRMTELYLEDLRQTDELDTAADMVMGSFRQLKKDKDEKDKEQGD